MFDRGKFVTQRLSLKKGILRNLTKLGLKMIREGALILNVNKKYYDRFRNNAPHHQNNKFLKIS